MINKAVLFLVFSAVAFGELVPYKSCYKRAGKEVAHCIVNDVTIDPCPEAKNNEPCKLKRGKSASIGFTFKTDFDVSGDLKARAFWMTLLADIPFLGMETDACKMTSCPLKKDEVNNFNFTLDLNKSFPAQTYDVKFKVWDDKGGAEKECCVTFKLKLD